MRTTSRIVAFIGIAAGLVALLGAAPVRAAEAKFTITVVRATNADPHMDPKLAKFANLLKNRGFNNFLKVKVVSFTLEVKGKKSFHVAANVSAEIEFPNEVNSRVAFKCRIFDGKKKALDIGYSIPRGGKTMVIFRAEPAYFLIIEVK